MPERVAKTYRMPYLVAEHVFMYIFVYVFVYVYIKIFIHVYIDIFMHTCNMCSPCRVGLSPQIKHKIMRRICKRDGLFL